MKKTISQRFFLSLCLMIVGCLWGSAAWAETITLSQTTIGSLLGTDGYKSSDFTYSGITWGRSKVYSSNGGIQIEAGTSKALWNKTAIPGAITKIIVTQKTNPSTLTVGTTTRPTTNSNSTAASSTATYTFNASDKFQYFKIAATNKFSVVTSIEIIYEPLAAINVSADALTFGDIETGYNDTKTFSISGTKLTPNSTASLTIDDKTNFSVSPSTIDVDADGKIAATDVTVKYAPTTTGNHSATLTITSGDLSETVSLSGTGIAPLAHYTLSWMVNGTTYATTESEGNLVTLPTNPEAIGSNVFMGWRASTISGTSASEPDGLFTTAEDAPVVTGNTTYYAVFAKLSSSTSSWNRVKTLAEITNGSYVIKSGTYVLPSTKETATGPKVTAAPTITNDVITGTVEESMTWYFTSTGNTNQFYVKNSGGDYLYATNTNNGIKVSSTSDKWTFSNNTTGYFSMQEANNNRYCGIYDNKDWRCYKTSTSNYINGGKLELYKLVIEETYDNYATTIATQPAANIHATTYYKKITSSDELVDGGQYVIVYTADEKGLLAGANNVHDATPATVVFEGNGTITTANAAAMTEITFEHNADANYYLSIGNSKYIKATNSDDLNVGTGKDNDALWTIGFDGNGNVEITSVAYNARGIFYSTAGSGSFKNYATSNRGQAGYPAIQLYQKVGEMPIAKATGYVSTYVADFAYVMPKHITGHTVTLAAEQGVIGTEKVFRAGDEVPALTPLLIKSDEDYAETSKNYNPAVLNKTVDAYTGDNMLEYRRTAQGLTNTMKDVSVYYYKLAINDGNVGFYWGATGGAAFEMTKPSTAYLTVPQDKAVQVQGFVLNLEEGEPTGIATVVTNEDAPIYNLQGIRMNGKNLPKGIYIQGGKKFMVK